jgi:hypothetical protein
MILGHAAAWDNEDELERWFNDVAKQYHGKTWAVRDLTEPVDSILQRLITAFNDDENMLHILGYYGGKYYEIWLLFPE